ncbi:uncharacterized protein LOC143150853 isoform X1 [Ptiloglossa arizonensis]|uniref:uncharacterized protein LOC143150853 isoform X1 n=1 Tax=Ptiloglossa arizonensis TaxID=3350558 RepID=UPI003FA10F59
MNRHRRYADDFTNTLHGFQYNTSSELDSYKHCSISEDSLDEIKTRKHTANNRTRSCKHSTILASSSTRDSFVSDASISSVTFVPVVPDLNKRIDLFKSENLHDQLQCNVDFVHSCNKIQDNKENDNPQCVMKDKQLQSGVSKALINELTPTSSKKEILQLHKKLDGNIVNKASERDTNYNIRTNQFYTDPILKENIHVTPLELSSMSDCADKDIHTPCTNCEHKRATDEVKKFETILYSLDNELNRMREASQQDQILKRLSNEYVHSPKNFTEKLLTIIEETVINNNDDDKCNTSATNLSRLTTEFRKMCKFIEDESFPEWPLSLMSTPPCLKQVLTTPVRNTSVPLKISKSEKLLNSPMSTTPVPSTIPLSAVDVIKRRFFRKLSKNSPDGYTDRLINFSSNVSSTESFERLEAQCKRLFPEEKECSQPLQRSISVPSLLSMTQMENICEQQMALLNVSNMSYTEKTILSTPNLSDKHLYQSPLIKKLRYKKELSSAELQPELNCESTNLKYDVFYSKKQHAKGGRKSDINVRNSNKCTNNYVTLDPDEFEKTLLQDIAEKRRRCLDTARLIKEINADTEVTEDEKSLRMSLMFATENESNSLTCDETKFIKTLMSCKDYQTYLEKQKPLFNSAMSNSSIPEVTFKNKNVSSRDVKNKSSPNIKSCIYKSPVSRNRKKETKEKTKYSKATLLFSPGKTPPNKPYKKKKVYFPSMDSPIKDTREKNILESLHEKGPGRLNYDNIISPVGMYIRGTDMQLIKNVRAKTDGLLLTPVKINDKVSPSRNSKQSTPSKCITKTPGKVPLKINLSPKLGSNQLYEQKIITSVASETNGTRQTDFVLPKVSYKLPLQVKTIKKTRTPKSGTRVKKLLQAAESKVVIRHQGRTNSIQKQKNGGIMANNEILEINYEPEDDSLHIEQAASKTNFIRKQRNI